MLEVRAQRDVSGNGDERRRGGRSGRKGSGGRVNDGGKSVMGREIGGGCSLEVKRRRDTFKSV